MHVMIDIETMGMGPTAAIVQIGAVKFDFSVGAYGEAFQETVALQSSIFSGGTIDQSTIEWWMQQERKAKQSISSKAVPLEVALDKLFWWLRKLEDEGGLEGVWSHGAAFDIPILEGAFRRCGVNCPWHHRLPRDTRTLLWLAQERGWVRHSDGVIEHIAVADAIEQVKEVVSAYQHLQHFYIDSAVQSALAEEGRDPPPVG